MAIFISDQLLNGGLPIRSNSTEKGSIQTRIKVPAGTAIASGDVLKFARVDGNIILKDATISTSDLDTGTAITATIGTVRATVDPSKAYNATTNPYITGSATADAAASLAASATIEGILRTGGVARATLAAKPDGIADVALTITGNPTGNPNADRFIDLVFEFGGLPVTPGEFSGGNSYNYTNETADLD